MARMRTVKPALRTSRTVASWPFEVRYFFVLLWGYLDDEGRGLDIPKTIAGDCFPLDDKVTPAVVNRWLTLMASTRDPQDPDKPPPVCRYEVAGRRYVHTVNAKEHQRPNRPQPSLLPPCPVHTKPRDQFTAPLTESVSDPPTDDALHETVPVVRGFEYLRGRGERSESGSESPDPPPLDPEPPAACRDHQDDPDPPACRRCKTARERHEAWLAQRRARLAAAPRCPEPGHGHELAANCRLCRSERLGAA